MGPLAWLKVLAENQQTITDVVKEGFRQWISGWCKRPTLAGKVQAALEAPGAD